MATAEIVMDGLPSPGGYEATLYRIDPPIKGTDHLLVYHRPPMWGQPGHMSVILATPGGVGLNGRMDQAPSGSFTTNTPDHILALQLAGGYHIVEPSPSAVAADLFEPADHNVLEVNAYLDKADPTEQVRILEIERAGKARKGILGGN